MAMVQGLKISEQLPAMKHCQTAVGQECDQLLVPSFSESSGETLSGELVDTRGSLPSCPDTAALEKI